jgi:hypothetical protein
MIALAIRDITMVHVELEEITSALEASKAEIAPVRPWVRWPVYWLRTTAARHWSGVPKADFEVVEISRVQVLALWTQT